MSIFAGLGELLWDVLPEGRTLGGAPANFAFHVNGLGGQGVVVSRIGADALGLEALDLLSGRGVDVSHVGTDPQRPTGTVLARLDDAGSATYSFPADVAWDALVPDEKSMALAGRVDGVCFGSLGQRSATSRAAIQSFLQATKADALRIFDVNLRQEFYSRDSIEQSLQLASVCKLSDEELPVLARLFDLSGNDETMLGALLARFDLRLIACTLGGAGSVLVTPDAVDRHPGIPTTLADTIGAGDSFTAALALGMHAGWALERINQRANEVAAFVCSQPGGMPLLPAALAIRN
jgi:fructokinase